MNTTTGSPRNDANSPRYSAGPLLIQPSSRAAFPKQLSDKYRLGEELGRGAYGRVFRGLDTRTGEHVAIKQLSLDRIPPTALASIMTEVDLLKALNHRNIVKYLGSFRSRSHLYIIMELVENGSLAMVIKHSKFGPFPESLVAVYIQQVLQGLTYLHDQGVVHRDIKGANILTTKEGIVKLADFGVAARLDATASSSCYSDNETATTGDEDCPVVASSSLSRTSSGGIVDGSGTQHVESSQPAGTPYWMAPEVIELKSVTSASDIWSVGCLAIELLTGQPPYYDLQPLSALYNIVQDVHPPLPPGASASMKDFLLQCFRKDPSTRPHAIDLLQHTWITYNRRTLRSTWNRTRAMKEQAAASQSRDDGKIPAIARNSMDAHASVASVVENILSHTSEYSNVKEYSASTASPRQDGETSRDDAKNKLDTPRDTTMAASASAASPSSLTTTKQGNTPAITTLTTTTMAIIDEDAIHQEEFLRCLDEDALGTNFLRQFDQQLGVFSRHHANDNNKSVSIQSRPTDHGSSPAGIPQSPLSSASQVSAAATHQHDAGGCSSFLGENAMLSNGDDASLHNDHAAKSQDRSGHRPSFADHRGSEAEVRRHTLSLRMLSSPGDNKRNLVEEAAAAASARALVGYLVNSPDLRTVFISSDGLNNIRDLLDSPAERVIAPTMDLLLALTGDDASALEGVCILGLVPAALRFAGVQHPVELRLRAARFANLLACSSPSSAHMLVACQGIPFFIAMMDDSIQSTEQLQLLKAATNGVWALLHRSRAPYWPLRSNQYLRLMAHHGLAQRIVKVLPWVLKHVATSMSSSSSSSVSGHSLVQSSIPSVQGGSTKNSSTNAGNEKKGFWSPASLLRSSNTSHSTNISPDTTSNPAASHHTSKTVEAGGFFRRHASNKIFPTTTATTTTVMTNDLQYNMSANSYTSNSGDRVSVSGAEAGHSMAPRTTLDGNSKNASTMAPPLVTSSTKKVDAFLLLESLVNLFATLTHGDTVVKSRCCQLDTINAMFGLTIRMPSYLQLRILQAVRRLSSDQSMLNQLESANVVSYVGAQLPREDYPALQAEGLLTLHNLCQLNSRSRQEKAAEAGAMPWLCRLALHPPEYSRQNNFYAAHAGQVLTPHAAAVAVLCSMAHGSPRTRAELWSQGGLNVLLQLLKEETHQVAVLEGLAVWLEAETPRLEARLVEDTALPRFASLFSQSSSTPGSMERLLGLISPLNRMLMQSSRLAVSLASADCAAKVTELLLKRPPPPVALALMDTLRLMHESHPFPKEFISKNRVVHALRGLEQNSDAILVRKQASNLLQAFAGVNSVF